jgi:anti-anti-sigma regulatory factor
VYAPQTQSVPAPVVMRLIGVLDADLVAAFSALERGLAGIGGGTLLVDVRDLQIVGEGEMHALAKAVAAARCQGRDVRLDARGLHWKRTAKKNLSTQPPVDAQLRSSARRTVIVAHSPRKKRG